MKYAFIRAHSDEHAVTRLCDLLGVSTSGYYDWHDRPESDRAGENRKLTKKIQHLHQRSNAIYGSPKIHKDLLAEGEHCGVNRVARLMRQADIQSKMRPKFVVTTNSRNTTAPAPDLLQHNFKVDEQDVAWVSDTTFIPTREGWLFLAVVLDLFSRQEARQSIFEYIEVFYNRQRRHETLNYMTPAEFEAIYAGN